MHVALAHHVVQRQGFQKPVANPPRRAVFLRAVARAAHQPAVVRLGDPHRLRHRALVIGQAAVDLHENRAVQPALVVHHRRAAAHVRGRAFVPARRRGRVVSVRRRPVLDVRRGGRVGGHAQEQQVQVRLQDQAPPRAPHVRHDGDGAVGVEVRGGGGAPERRRLPLLRLGVPTQERALQQPPQRAGGALRDDVLEIVERAEQRALYVRLDVARIARQAARHSLEHHTAHARLRDGRAERLAVRGEPRGHLQRQRARVSRVRRVFLCRGNRRMRAFSRRRPPHLGGARAHHERVSHVRPETRAPGAADHLLQVARFQHLVQRRLLAVHVRGSDHHALRGEVHAGGHRRRAAHHAERALAETLLDERFFLRAESGVVPHHPPRRAGGQRASLLRLRVTRARRKTPELVHERGARGDARVGARTRVRQPGVVCQFRDERVRRRLALELGGAEHDHAAASRDVFVFLRVIALVHERLAHELHRLVRLRDRRGRQQTASSRVQRRRNVFSPPGGIDCLVLVRPAVTARSQAEHLAPGHDVRAKRHRPEVRLEQLRVEPARQPVDVRQRRAHADDLRRRRRRVAKVAAETGGLGERHEVVVRLLAVSSRARRRGVALDSLARREEQLGQSQLQRPASARVLHHVQLVHHHRAQLARALLLDEARHDVVELLGRAHQQPAAPVGGRESPSAPAEEAAHLDLGFRAEHAFELVRALAAQADERQDHDPDRARDGVQAPDQQGVRDERLPAARRRAVHQVGSVVEHALQTEARALPRV